MKRSIQEIIELLVFGLIAVLIGTGLLWVVGWVIGALGDLFRLLAGLIWSLLRFIVPIAVVGAAVYALVRLLQGERNEPTPTGTSSTTTTTGRSVSPTEPGPATGADASTADTPSAATATRTTGAEPAAGGAGDVAADPSAVEPTGVGHDAATGAEAEVEAPDRTKRPLPSDETTATDDHPTGTADFDTSRADDGASGFEPDATDHDEEDRR